MTPTLRDYRARKHRGRALNLGACPAPHNGQTLYPWASWRPQLQVLLPASPPLTWATWTQVATGTCKAGHRAGSLRRGLQGPLQSTKAPSALQNRKLGQCLGHFNGTLFLTSAPAARRNPLLERLPWRYLLLAPSLPPPKSQARCGRDRRHPQPPSASQSCRAPRGRARTPGPPPLPNFPNRGAENHEVNSWPLPSV